jgi:hypothetical protein
MFWDRVFGTYAAPTAERPAVGLQGSPPLSANPLRLAFAGVLQLCYELKHNRGILTRLRILFGASSWSPERTRDFVLV